MYLPAEPKINVDLAPSVELQIQTVDVQVEKCGFLYRAYLFTKSRT